MLVSVSIPLYNLGKALPRAVDSVLAQSYPNWEIIIVNDGSTDDGFSARVADEQAARDDRIRVIHQENGGLSVALNRGFDESTGEALLVLSSDDAIAPNHMENTVKVLKQDPSIDLVSSDMLVHGNRVPCRAGDLDTLMHSNCHHYAALFRRWLYDKTGGFKDTMNPSWEDYEFFLHCAKLGARWKHINLPLFHYYPAKTGRDASSQDKLILLRGKLEGYHQDVFGLGKGLVTFIVPCYNHEKYVAGAVQSALDQIYPHVNVVVVDDGSPGDVAAALREVADNRVTLIRQDNKHLSSARNTGIYYALQEFGSEYLVMLDADDEVHPEYVEVTLSALYGQEYIYTDVKFIGDAYHSLPMEEYDCTTLMKKHLHPSTFLQPSRMWEDIVADRGYGYDEAMKQGYEDWEYALAGLQSGWCGRRIPGEYFYYRYHKDGSMRTEAKKVSNEIIGYMRGQHSWMNNKDQVVDMCKTCGGRGRFTVSQVTGGVSSVFIPGVGEVAPLEMIEVEYTGSTTSTMTKQGAGGQIYKYSGDADKQVRGYGPKFTIRARDAHLFRGPFKMQRIRQAMQQLSAEKSPAAARRVEVVEVKREPQPSVVPQPEVEAKPIAKQKLDEIPVEQALELTDAGTEYAPEDFTEIKGIGSAGHEKLVAAGFTMYDDVVDAPASELAMVLGISPKQAERIMSAAAELIKELEE